MINCWLQVLKSGPIVSLLTLIGLVISGFSLQFKSDNLKWYYLMWIGVAPTIYLLLVLWKVVSEIEYIIRDWHAGFNFKSICEHLKDALKDDK